MQTTIKTITPAWAKKKLDELQKLQDDGTFVQRPPRLRLIRQYARDMLAGKWLVTHQGIAFDELNRLLDGQNRLWAVVKSNVPVQMLVTTGLPKNGTLPVMDVIDGGASRSLANILQISHGYSSGPEVASIARQVIRMVAATAEPAIDSPAVSSAMALFVMEKLNYHASFERLVQLIPERKLRRAPVSSCLCWYWMVHKEKAEAFATDYATLENLGKGAPPLMLYRYFMDVEKKKRVRIHEVEKQSVVALALRSYDNGTTAEHLVPSVKVALRWLVGLNPKHSKAILELLK